jgi:hypothetical protein
MELIVIEHTVTGDAASLPSLYTGIFFRALPFAWEIRTFVDWTVTPTALTAFMWFK